MVSLIAEKLGMEPSLLLEKNASLENIASVSKEEFIASLSESIAANLKSAIALEIRKSLKT